MAEYPKKYLDWVASQTHCLKCGVEFSGETGKWEWVKGFLCKQCFNIEMPMGFERLNRVLRGGKP